MKIALEIKEGDKKIKHLNEIKIAEIEGTLYGLRICKELWAQGVISHQNIQENICHFEKELESLNSK